MMQSSATRDVLIEFDLRRSQVGFLEAPPLDHVDEREQDGEAGEAQDQAQVASGRGLEIKIYLHGELGELIL